MIATRRVARHVLQATACVGMSDGSWQGMSEPETNPAALPLDEAILDVLARNGP
eukprot:gene52356-71401_t